MTSRDTERTFLRGRWLQRNVSQQEAGTHFDHTYSKGFSKKLAMLLAICLLATRTGANNVNEPPILEPGGYPAGLPLSESTKVGTEVFVLKGHDPEGSPVKYGIQLTDHFVVNPRTGVITLAKPLNREEYDTIRFRVTLEDEVPTGQQPNIVGVDAYVIVLDENDNPPRFLNVPYEAVAEEDLPVGSTILPGIRVMDPDMLGDTIDLTCVPQPQSCRIGCLHCLNHRQTEN